MSFIINFLSFLIKIVLNFVILLIFYTLITIYNKNIFYLLFKQTNFVFY